MANWLLVIITAVYAGLTYWIIRDNRRSVKLSANPIVGIRIDDIVLGKAFLHGRRRQMGVPITVANLGDSAAVNVVLDAELEYSHVRPEGETRLPSRFTRSIPYLRANEDAKSRVGYFGRHAVDGLLADFQEATRLNRERIENHPHDSAINATKLRIFAYYSNNLGQSFRSTYETFVAMWDQPEPIDEQEIHFVELGEPRVRFKSGPIDGHSTMREVESRDSIRDKGGG